MRARMHLEFAPPGRRITPANALLLLLGAVALGLCLLALLTQLRAYERQTQQLAALERASGKTTPPTTSAARRDPVELARAQFVRKTARSLGTPWAELLAALEATPTTVALLSVEPSPAKHSVTLTAEAASPTQMLAYLRRLQTDQRLSDVVLVSHQLQAQAPGTPLRFQLEGHWGDAP